MVLARTAPSFALIVILAGCGSGAVARGCSAGCRSGSRAARSSSHALDDLGRGIARTQPGRYGLEPGVPGRIGGRIGGQVGHVGQLGQVGHAGERIAVSGLDDAVAALPPVEGPVSSLAAVPSSRGATMTSRAGTRGLAEDYARSVDALRITREQHAHLLDAFDAAQSIFDAVNSGDDASDDPAAREPAARRRIEAIAEVMARKIPEVLDRDQVPRLYAALGTPEVIVYRLARERPMTRAASAGSPTSAGAEGAGAAAP